MLLLNEKLEWIDSEDLIREINNEIANKTADFFASMSDADIQSGEIYLQAESLIAPLYYDNESIATLISTKVLPYSPKKSGKKIFKKIKEILCKYINNDSSIEKITDWVIKALAVIIPGGILIGTIARKIIYFILKTGISAFCKI
mgnify:CR=1 FL=1